MEVNKMIKDIHVQSCWNCRPKPICNCGNEGFGFEIKDCKRINLFVGNHEVGKSFVLRHVNLKGKPPKSIDQMTKIDFI